MRYLKALEGLNLKKYFIGDVKCASQISCIFIPERFNIYWLGGVAEIMAFMGGMILSLQICRAKDYFGKV